MRSSPTVVMTDSIAARFDFADHPRVYQGIQTRGSGSPTLARGIPAAAVAAAAAVSAAERGVVIRPSC